MDRCVSAGTLRGVAFTTPTGFTAVFSFSVTGAGSSAFESATILSTLGGTAGFSATLLSLALSSLLTPLTATDGGALGLALVIVFVV